jgi:hypothetical protein
VSNSREFEVAEQFLSHADEDSLNDLFRILSPQLVAFFQKRGHQTSAEDLAQEVMLTVCRKASQIRDHKLFRAGLFKVARNVAGRYFTAIAGGTNRRFGGGVGTVTGSVAESVPANY